MERKDFAARLSELRINKGASSREMSLAIGQSAGYINNIENGINLPSMTAFFYICEYLDIEPKDFFDIENTNPIKTDQLTEAVLGLSNEQLDNLISIARGLRK